jgi:hypothetical protein
MMHILEHGKIASFPIRYNINPREGTQIHLLKKRKDFGAFQFLTFVLPAAPAAAATLVEAATTVGIKAATTVGVASTATTIACQCLVHYYRACSKQQYRSYDTSDNEYCSYPCIHCNIRLYYPFIGSYI